MGGVIASLKQAKTLRTHAQATEALTIKEIS